MSHTLKKNDRKKVQDDEKRFDNYQKCQNRCILAAGNKVQDDEKRFDNYQKCQNRCILAAGNVQKIMGVLNCTFIHNFSC